MQLLLHIQLSFLYLYMSNTKTHTEMKKLIKLTIEEIRNNEAKSYNESEWNKKITRWAAFEGIQFYMIPKDEIYRYDRFFASYMTPEGIRFFNSFDYSSCLSNAAFNVIKIAEDGSYEMIKLCLPNNKPARDLMEDICKTNKDIIFTTESI